MWFFSAPNKIIYGEEALEGLNEIKGKKALIITDKTLHQLGMIKPVISILNSIPIKYVVFTDVDPEPSILSAKHGAEVALKENVDLIIAIGGGSVIDVAKAIWVLYENPDMNIDEVFPEDPLILRKKAKFITIPTTSGTGSDANWAIVLKDPETKQKISVAHRDIIPDLDIVDPMFAKEMPANLIASTGFDALTHAIEAASVDWKNDFSTAFSHRAIELIFKYLSRSVKNNSDTEAKEKMHIAATMAGIAFGNSQIGGVHALGHALGSSFSLPHSEIIAVVLPHMMRFCIKDKTTEKIYADIAYHAKISSNEKQVSAILLIEKIEDFMKDLNLKTKLSDFGISKKQLEDHMDEIISFTISDTGSLVNPCELNEESIITLCRNML